MYKEIFDLENAYKELTGILFGKSAISLLADSGLFSIPGCFPLNPQNLQHSFRLEFLRIPRRERDHRCHHLSHQFQKQPEGEQKVVVVVYEFCQIFRIQGDILPF